ncbi:MAG: hypothetical protein BJ554DRAFT_8110, partial [Olpidium bornovanus]
IKIPSVFVAQAQYRELRFLASVINERGNPFTARVPLMVMLAYARRGHYHGRHAAGDALFHLRLVPPAIKELGATSVRLGPANLRFVPADQIVFRRQAKQPRTGRLRYMPGGFCRRGRAESPAVQPRVPRRLYRPVADNAEEMLSGMQGGRLRGRINAPAGHAAELPQRVAGARGPVAVVPTAGIRPVAITSRGRRRGQPLVAVRPGGGGGGVRGSGIRSAAAAGARPPASRGGVRAGEFGRRRRGARERRRRDGQGTEPRAAKEAARAAAAGAVGGKRRRAGAAPANAGSGRRRRARRVTRVPPPRPQKKNFRRQGFPENTTNKQKRKKIRK